MRISVLRISGIALALALIGGGALYWKHAHAPSDAELGKVSLLPSHWIALPEMPARLEDLDTRQALVDVLAWEALMEPSRNPPLGSPHDSRLARCGRLGTWEEDRYRLWVQVSEWGAVWRVDFRTSSDSAELAHFELGPTTPPHHPPRDLTSDQDRLRLSTDLGGVRLSSLEEIRSLWQSTALWRAPQGGQEEACYRGSKLVLDACVGGKYAIRAHRCGSPSDSEAEALIAATEGLIKQQRTLVESGASPRAANRNP